MKDKPGSSVVKVDSSLIEKVEKFIKKEENRLKFINKKHFVDLAIKNYLDELNQKEKDRSKNKKDNLK